MDLMHGVLVAMVLLAAAGAVFLLLQRGGLSARAAAAEAGRAAADQARIAAEAESARIRAELAASAARVVELTGRVADLAARCQAVEEARRQDGAEAEQRLAETCRAAEELARARADETQTRYDERLARTEQVYKERLAAVDQARAQIQTALDQMQERFTSVFGNLAGEALKQSSEQFLALAQQRLGAQFKEGDATLTARKVEVERLVQPIADSLRKTELKLGEIESLRTASFADLRAQIENLGRAGSELRTETQRLVTALREPHVRGRYGEMQLRRVAELAGMTSYCDFSSQDTLRDAEGNALRPDMVVRLPNGREIVVDAKANIHAYLEALEATAVDAAEACMVRFARHVADTAAALGRKGYWQQYAGSPEFVVMFLPGDQFLDAALSRRPDLLDIASSQRVILATPSSLIALLRAVAVGFAEQRLSDEAKNIRALAGELHGRAVTVFEHISSLGKAIQASVERYNSVIGSVDSRLVPTLRRLEDTGISVSQPVPELKQVDGGVRQLLAAPSPARPAAPQAS